jgi:hypothetical protein
VKEKVVHLGLLFQMSPLGTSWAWPSRSCAERGGDLQTDKQMTSQAMLSYVQGGGGSVGRAKTASGDA